ncbi:MAG: hypothetical protein Edafosvirus6_55 [Edafosvirus sp.]|uniref:Uncharacterized protein n=1 Tax=Edafosvirus sp. TaxID=2487765 RepID=A0A3G4ZTH7_9VIRU|nr:MAG: hypothetical protein Edafosvirus6_55 [Edafosvirus sp.]
MTDNKSHLNSCIVPSGDITQIKKDLKNLLESDIKRISIFFNHKTYKKYEQEKFKAMFSVSTKYSVDQIEKEIGVGWFKEFSYEFIEMLDDFLQRNKIITAIDWICNKMDSDCCKRFNQLLLNNKNITKLKIKDIHSSSLYDVILKNVSLKELTIRSPNLTYLSELLLSPLIKSIKITLNESEVDFDFETLKHALSNTNSLTYIGIDETDNMEYNYLDLDVILKFMKCFLESKNQSLKKLFLCVGYEFEFELGNKVREYISKNKTITKLEYICRYIKDIEYLCKNDCIEELTILGPKCETNFIKSIEKLISVNKKIIKLKIPRIPNGEECKNWIEAIKKNQTIEKIDAEYGVKEEWEKHKTTHKEWDILMNAVNNIKKLKKQYCRTYLDLFAGYQIIPVINIINDYVGLNVK